VLSRDGRHVRARPAFTLIELVVAIVVGAIVLALIAGIALRQRRVLVALLGDAALNGQLRDAGSMLPGDFRAASVAAGDVREATDSSLELRETIASAVICDTLRGSVVLAPFVGGDDSFAAGLSAPAADDTAWILTAADSASRWLPFRIASATAARPGQCVAGGPRLGVRGLASPRTSLALDSAGAPPALVGRALRITRPIRYSVYRSSDGRWYLGARDWNSGTSRFNTIQPLAGPFEPPTSATPAFQWFDSGGSRLFVPSGLSSVALLRVDLRGQTREADFVLGAARDTGRRRDSVQLFVSTRNRR
jgi:prepilin-type N-terminal cleavage/methylation domain-containing protein